MPYLYLNYEAFNYFISKHICLINILMTSKFTKWIFEELTLSNSRSQIELADPWYSPSKTGLLICLVNVNNYNVIPQTLFTKFSKS